MIVDFQATATLTVATEFHICRRIDSEEGHAWSPFTVRDTTAVQNQTSKFFQPHDRPIYKLFSLMIFSTSRHVFKKRMMDFYTHIVSEQLLSLNIIAL